jgi:phytanoyl-CoA hydroxylase
MQRAVSGLLGQPGKVVQSMYFHGNPASVPHQDSYYLDSEVEGAMVAAWIAAEDIEPGAGRFFVYPGSHRIDMRASGVDFAVVLDRSRYRRLVRDALAAQGLECRAPALAQGDVLFWNANTIHGSLSTTQPGRSRRSLTAHYLPGRDRLKQFKSRLRHHAFDDVAGMKVARPKDQARWLNRAILFIETRFPDSFTFVKRAMTRYVTR